MNWCVFELWYSTALHSKHESIEIIEGGCYDHSMHAGRYETSEWRVRLLPSIPEKWTLTAQIQFPHIWKSIFIPLFVNLKKNKPLEKLCVFLFIHKHKKEW